MSRIVFLLLFSAVFLVSSANAQQMIRVRAGEHGSYSRIVFDWDSPVGLTVNRITADTLHLNFNRRAALDLSDAASVRLANIHSVEQLAASGENTLAQVRISPGSSFKQLTVGSKIVLDVMPSPGKAAQPSKPPPEDKKEPREEAKIPEQSKEPEPVKPAEPAARSETETAAPVPQPSELENLQEQLKPQGEQVIVDKAEEPKPLPPAADQKQQEGGDFKLYKPHVITVSVTEAVGMASFIRDGFLWIVLDRPGISIVPQITGPQKAGFPPIENMKSDSGTAYRMKLPEGAFVYAEGGGLIWRLVVTPNKKNLKAAEVQRRFKAGNNLRNGSLFWLMPQATKILEIADPLSGEKIFVAPVKLADEFAGPEREFVDLKVLNSIAGLAVAPKNNRVAVAIERPGVLISHPEGLALMNEAEILSRKARNEKKEAALDNDQKDNSAGNRTIYNFDRWQMGGNAVLESNQRVLLAGLSTKDQTGLVEELITIAKLNMANGWGTEALGFLDLASQYLPALLESPEFLSLRGAASALSRKYEPAFEDLSVSALDGNMEINFWRSYVLAGLEDWQQADKNMPSDFEMISSYPKVIRVPVGLSLAEVALRAGNVSKGEQLLTIVEKDSGSLPLHYKNTWQYLSGEARRQRGRHDEAQSLWQPLAEGFDELFRAKAGLALTEMLLADARITAEEAIDRLERLRYIWRGDELETRINYRLGKVYIGAGEFTKGLGILRDAAALAPKSKLGRQIAEEMTVTFKDLFLSNNYRKLTPLEAITLYEQFPELTPTGSEGDRLVEKLAETLVEADLLDRAAKILDHQIEHRLEGSEAARVSIRLAAIYLINQEPEKAAGSLDRAERILSAINDSSRKMRDREIKLLRARSLSQLSRPMQAIGMLVEMPVDPDVNRLRADIAWRAGEWDEAAEALGQMIVDAGVSPSRMLTPLQAELILNRAVALNLADNRVALSQLRERYEAQMKNTPRARIFEVMTRPRKASVLSDRETLMSVVSEVDIFKEFLDTYKEGSTEAK